MLGFLKRNRGPKAPTSYNIDDLALRRQVMDTVEQALAVLHTTAEGRLTSARVPWLEDDDVLAYKLKCRDGVDFEICIEHPDLGPSLFATTRRHSQGVVRWMPGAGFTDPAAFLAWFKDHAGIGGGAS